MNCAKTIPAILAFAALCMASCRPQPATVPTTTPKVNKNDVFAALATTPQQFTIRAGMAKTITGFSGTKVVFYPTSFKDGTGATLVSGDVKIELTEMYKPGDAIANYSATTSGGSMLRSGGQVLIKATMDGKEVYANKYGICFKQDLTIKEPMWLFYGNRNNADSVTEWTQTAALTGATADSTIWVKDTVTGLPDVFYIFDSCASFGWVNCDAFYSNTAPKTDITISQNNTIFTVSNTAYYMVFSSINSTMYVRYTGATTATAYQIPMGMECKVLSISYIGDKYYYYESPLLTVTANMQITTTPTQQSLAYIQDKLRKL